MMRTISFFICIVLCGAACGKKTTERNKKNEFLEKVGILEIEDKPSTISREDVQGLYLWPGKAYGSPEAKEAQAFHHGGVAIWFEGEKVNVMHQNMELFGCNKERSFSIEDHNQVLIPAIEGCNELKIRIGNIYEDQLMIQTDSSSWTSLSTRTEEDLLKWLTSYNAPNDLVPERFKAYYNGPIDFEGVVEKSKNALLEFFESGILKFKTVIPFVDKDSGIFVSPENTIGEIYIKNGKFTVEPTDRDCTIRDSRIQEWQEPISHNWNTLVYNSKEVLFDKSQILVKNENGQLLVSKEVYENKIVGRVVGEEVNTLPNDQYIHYFGNHRTFAINAGNLSINCSFDIENGNHITTQLLEFTFKDILE